MMSIRRTLVFLLLMSLRTAAAEPSLDKALEAMKKAARFMVEDVSTNGGCVWAYLPDLSRRWGEMEAYDSMIWVQPPGTTSMGTAAFLANMRLLLNYVSQAGKSGPSGKEK